jgi:hypothetical protein
VQNLFRYDGTRVLVCGCYSENVYTDGGAGNGMLTGAIKPPSIPGR